MTAPFVCSCGWRGFEPSMSDASEVRLIGDEWVLVRDHIPLCPLCFQQVRRDLVQPRATLGASSRV